MSIMGTRPKIRDCHIEIVEGGTKKKIKAPDLNDVLRGIVVDLRNTWGMSTRQLSFRLGMRQQTLSAFLNSEIDQGTRLETVSAICGALDMTISELFELHPVYGGQKSDRRWHILRNSINAKALDELVETAMLGTKVGAIDKLISNQLEMMRALAEAQGIDVASVQKEAKRIARA